MSMTFRNRTVAQVGPPEVKVASVVMGKRIAALEGSIGLMNV